MFGADGTFLIHKYTRGKTYECRMRISLRDDDAPIVQKIHDYFGMGSVCPIKVVLPGNPQIRWEISAIGDCIRMIKHFDNYPLQCKKANHYKIWRSAVLEMQKPRKIRDYHYLSLLKQQLHEVKKYKANPKKLPQKSGLQPPLFVISE